jgi:hypothetical protein
MSLVVLIGVMLLGGTFFIYMIPDSMDVGLQSVLFVIVLLLAGTIFTSTIFSDLGEKKKSIATLTLPVSHFEKYLVAWLYSFVIFLLTFTGTFYLILIFLLHLNPVPGRPIGVFNIFSNPVGYLMITLFALLQSIAFYGAIFFEKLHFIKTGLIFFISFAALIFINKIFLSLLLQKDVSPTMPFGNIRLLEKGKDVIVKIPEWQADPLLWFMLVLAFLFWIAAYYRLKEKQV